MYRFSNLLLNRTAPFRFLRQLIFRAPLITKSFITILGNCMNTLSLWKPLNFYSILFYSILFYSILFYSILFSLLFCVVLTLSAR